MDKIDKYAPHIDPSTIDLDKDFHDQDPMFDLLGFTNIDAIDLVEGFASGIYNKDVRGQYNQCIVGLPTFGLKIYNTIMDLKINSLGDLFKEWSKLMSLATVLTEIVAEAPEDI